MKRLQLIVTVDTDERGKRTAVYSAYSPDAQITLMRLAPVRAPREFASGATVLFDLAAASPECDLVALIPRMVEGEFVSPVAPPDADTWIANHLRNKDHELSVVQERVLRLETNVRTLMQRIGAEG